MNISKLLILVLLVSSTSLSQEKPDSAFFRFGILADYDGSVIDQFGLKYRTNLNLSVYLRGQFNTHENTYSDPSQYPYSRNDFKLTAGTEYILLTVYDVSLLASASFAYGTGRLEQGHPASQGGTNYQLEKTNSYLVGFAAGVEYYFTKQLSLSVYDNLEYAYSKSSVEYLTTTTIRKSTGFRAPVAFLTLTFYL